ncbi:MAG: AAA family ATPase [Deltaproteobacteria bacterium]|nr:AAA family ATPase [Deltaproteobacteria bacterium]
MNGSLDLNLDMILVDEISMVRADLFDCADVFLRAVTKRKKIPFGGVQMIFIGDLYQLPPVIRPAERQALLEAYAGPHFFNANIFSQMRPQFVELEKVYRQKDAEFIRLLNAVRNNTLTEKDVAAFNRRHDPDFDPAIMKKGLHVVLTATNDHAEAINRQRLSTLSGKIFRYEGEVGGDFLPDSFPTAQTLEIKKDAQVMLLNNDSLGRWVNGTMARVISAGSEEITVCLENGSRHELEPYTWEMFRHGYDSRLKSLTTETIGTFTQYPLKLAWAVTIHKSQGKTFDHVVIDTGRGIFASGQMYVALSRCRSLDGMILKKPLTRGQALIDWAAVKFLTGFQYARSEEYLPLSKKMEMIREAIENGSELEMIYLKASDVKSKRRVRPIEMGEMEYAGKTFPGLRAFCKERGEERTFRVDRILEMKVV